MILNSRIPRITHRLKDDFTKLSECSEVNSGFGTM